jgi:DNA-binding MarR family transcriptional regulator
MNAHGCRAEALARSLRLAAMGRFVPRNNPPLMNGSGTLNDMVALDDTASVDSALEAFRQLMATLQLARARRGDPWSDYPITLPQVRALNVIAAASGGLSSRELASLLGVGASAVTPLVDRLVDHGFVLRHEDPRDRRVARLVATESGRTTLARLVAGKGDLMREALATLTPDQVHLVTTALDLLRSSVEERI